MKSKNEVKAPNDVIVARRLAKTYTSANNRGKPFNLTFDYMKNIMAQTVCAYSGEPFGGGEHEMTLERWDNDKGYVIGNVIPVKSKYNNLRADLTIEQMTKATGLLLKECDTIENYKPNELTGKALALYNEIQNMRKNLQGRKDALANSPEGKEPELRATLIKRIAQGENHINTSLAQLNKLKTEQCQPNLMNHVKTNQNAIHGYGIIVQALQRLNAMSVVDYLNLKKGLPITKRG